VISLSFLPGNAEDFGNDRLPADLILILIKNN